MRTIFLLLASLCVLVLGCRTGQSASSSPAAEVAACPEGNATGQWSGTETGVQGDWAFTATIWHEGTTLKAKSWWNNIDDGATFDLEFAGAIQCATRAFILRTVNSTDRNGVPATSTITGSLGPDFATMIGTWDGGGKLTGKKS